MKKISLTLCMTLAGLAASAQTNFREISFDEGLKAAKAENKLLFVDCYTSWCGPCKMMANTVFPDSTLGAWMNSKFVCMKIDMEKGEGPEPPQFHQRSPASGIKGMCHNAWLSGS